MIVPGNNQFKTLRPLRIAYKMMLAAKQSLQHTVIPTVEVYPFGNIAGD